MILKAWIEIAGLSSEGLMDNQNDLKDVGVKFNKVTKYMSLTKNPYTFTFIVAKAKGKQIFDVGPLLLEHRFLKYVIDWIITPRGS